MQSLKIENFKNLRNLSIDTLSQVNLIVGNNNVGKSTLLEAIMLFKTEGHPYAIEEILKARGELYDPNPLENTIETEKYIQSISTLVTNRNLNLLLNLGIRFKTDTQVFNLTLTPYIQVEKKDSEQGSRFEDLPKDFSKSEYPDALYGIRVITLHNDEGQYNALYPLRLGLSRFRSLSQRSLPPIQYIKTNQLSKSDNATLFDKLALTPLEPEIINALNIIDPNIQAINFLMDDYKLDPDTNRLKSQRVPYIVYKGSNEKVRLSSMGDGINRILTIILALLNAKDGFLLIDEFDNGLHHSVQTQLWEIVYKLAVDLNVQVFATTHSNDCIKSFVKADPEHIGKLIRLEEVEGDITAITFDNQEKLQYAIDQNIEIR